MNPLKSLDVRDHHLPLPTLYGNCVGEEPGWRGFALRKLLSQYILLVASLIVNFVWDLWRIPIWYIENEALTTAYQVRQFVIGGAIGITFSWLYYRSARATACG